MSITLTSAQEIFIAVILCLSSVTQCTNEISKRSKYKIGIITSLHSLVNLHEYAARFEWATNTKICYVSNFMNYEFILYTGPFDFLPTNTSGNEAKPYVLRKLLLHYEWVMWMDADTFFQQYSYPLEPFLLHNAHVVLQDFNDEISFNNGVFFVKNSPIGFRFLNIWIDMLENYCGNHEWAYFDQNAMLETIMVMLNETRIISKTIPYAQQCREYPEGCTKNANCYVGWLDKLGHKYEHRNDHGNNFIQFWSMPVSSNSPHRAFGYFHYWPLFRYNQCFETDIICHNRPMKEYYKRLEKQTNFSIYCPNAIIKKISLNP